MNSRSFVVLMLSLVACSDVEGKGQSDEDANHGLTTAVHLTFTETTSGEERMFVWSDPELDGVDILVDDVALPEGTSWSLSVSFWNELVDPPEDVTVEVEEAAAEHQIFLTGDAVDGPASDQPGAPLVVDYADADENGLPIGLLHNVVVDGAGEGALEVTLRHMPPEGGVAVKTEDVSSKVREDGNFAGVGGDNDVQVSFAFVATPAE